MEEFGTKTALKLLKVLFENPMREFKEIELIKSAETGKGAASQTIDKLLKKEILLEKRIGKTKVINLNLRNKEVYFLKMLFEKESDIDILIVCDNLDDISEERKKIEELFGEKFNIHCYSEDEIKNKMKEDSFIKNAFIKGVIVEGYDFGGELFVSLTLGTDIDRLLFLNSRIKSAFNNYLKKDYAASKEILDKAIEQLIFYILSNKGVEYTSKKDAYETILKLPEGKEIERINKVEFGKRINLIEELVLRMIREEILEGEGYVNR